MLGYSYGKSFGSTLSPSFLLTQAIFEPKRSPYEYPKISQT